MCCSSKRVPRHRDAGLARLRSLVQGTASRNATFTTPDTLLAGIRKLRGAISLSVGAIAALCLLLGAATLTA